MKILYHHRTQAEDGQAVHIRSLMQAFEEEGHGVREVGLVQRHRDGGAKAAPPPGAGQEESGGSRWSWIGKVPRFAREIAEYAYTSVARGRILKAAADFEPDFLYERYAFGCAGGVQASRRLGKPIVLEVNSPMVLELQKTRGLSFPRLAKRFETQVFRDATRVCVVTGVLRDMLIEMGVEAESLFVCPNGVHLEQYGTVNATEARSNLGLSTPLRDADLVLGFVGYYRDWHRLDLVLESMVQADLARAHLVLVGEGPAHATLEARARELGVEARLHFAGRLPHDRIPGILPAFDVALVPAINPYASPLKLHEYMASSLATIAPDQPNLREVLTDGRNALLVEPGDGDAMGAAILRLARDPALRRDLGAAARATIVDDEMTWRGNARRVVAAVESIR